MKSRKIFFVLLVSLLASVEAAYSQNINWANLKNDQRHIAKVHAGFDYGFVYGVAYSYQLRSKVPLLLNVDFSTPVGEKVLDDFRSRIGGILRIGTLGDFQFSASVHGIYRRYENSQVRLQNFGSDFKGTAGYYKRKWFVAGEVGFDKAIVTQFKHSELFRENFPDVKDGWYQPATGGNFSYGVQVGYSFRQSDIVLRLGSVVTQDFKTKPTVPLYAEIGYNLKIAEKLR